MSETVIENQPIKTKCQLHPSIFYTRLIHRSGRRGAGAYPSGHGREAGYTLDRLSVNSRLLKAFPDCCSTLKKNPVFVI